MELTHPRSLSQLGIYMQLSRPSSDSTFSEQQEFYSQHGKLNECFDVARYPHI
jgi:hypothetical protein